MLLTLRYSHMLLRLRILYVIKTSTFNLLILCHSNSFVFKALFWFVYSYRISLKFWIVTINRYLENNRPIQATHGRKSIRNGLKYWFEFQV